MEAQRGGLDQRQKFDMNTGGARSRGTEGDDPGRHELKKKQGHGPVLEHAPLRA